jgi:hypothetical protein
VTIHTTLQKTPAQLVFGRDMILNVTHIANWELIKQRKQRLINKENANENAKRHPHQYQEGDCILLNRGTENIYESPYEGPYEVLKVHDNGTVRIQRGTVQDTVNIRRKNLSLKLNSLVMGENATGSLQKPEEV